MFLIELRYPKDKRAPSNRAFLESVRKGDFRGYTTIYNLFEICGILSFNLSPQYLEEIFLGFSERFNVTVLFPEDGEKICFEPERVFDFLRRRMSFGDALIADVLRKHRHSLDAFVTWNEKHFRNRIPLPVVNPCLIQQQKD